MIFIQNTLGMKRSILLAAIYFIITSCSTQEIKWVALGDSITYLNDHKDETGDRVTKGYMTLVTEALPHVTYTNIGKNGWTAVRVANEIDNLALVSADIYTVFLGTNDWWATKPVGSFDDYTNSTGIQTFFGSYRIIVDKLRSLNGDAHIILITPMQRVDFVYINDSKNNAFGSYKEKDGQSLNQFADAVKAIAEHESLEIVDLYSEPGMALENLVKFKRIKNPETGEYKDYRYPDFIDIPFDSEVDEYPYPPEAIDITYDGLHPSDAGYEIIAKRLIEILKK